jgi:hypothetical protein
MEHAEPMKSDKTTNRDKELAILKKKAKNIPRVAGSAAPRFEEWSSLNLAK